MTNLQDLTVMYQAGYIRDFQVQHNRWFATTVYWGSADIDSLLVPLAVYNNGDVI